MTARPGCRLPLPPGSGAARPGWPHMASPAPSLICSGRGPVSAGFLDPYKARLILHALLAAGADRRAIADAFAQLA
jgi:hypothetical protein